MINSQPLPFETHPFDFIQAELSAANIPGCFRVIVDRGGIISSGAFGYADLQQ